jgi:hypothetical protein
MAALTTNELWTLGIAGYAAVVATFVLGWDAYKWLDSGPKVKITASTGMKQVGGGRVDPKTYILVTAVNWGDRATTITNMGFLYYDRWWKAYGPWKRSSKAFIITTPSQAQVIPYRFEAGAQWMGMADQTIDVEQMIRATDICLCCFTTQLVARVFVSCCGPKN